VKHLNLVFVFILFVLGLNAAWINNMPITITQPDGQKIECFATGDEFHNWLHDKDNYTIIRSIKTGYYTYAVKDGEGVKAGDLIVGRDDPQRSSLRPGINISTQLYQQQRLSLEQENIVRDYRNVGFINNLVVFIRFSDQSEFGENISLYDGWLNSNTSSLKNYYLEASYNQLTVNTTFYPLAVGGMVVSYQDPHPRSYYCPYDSIGNPDGYEDGDESWERKSTLIAAAVDAIAPLVPTGLNIDFNNDGLVDNMAFVIAGEPTAWATLLWPQKTQLSTIEKFINGKRVYSYNLQIQTHLAGSNVGVLCHEFFHTLGAPDLYHYTEGSLVTPAYRWDLMDQDQNPPQHMSAFMKWKYGHWIDSIPLITADVNYTLNPITSDTDNVYRIDSPYSMTEYFVVEYRRQTGTFESSIPGSGLLVWRINTTCGNGNADGPPDEVYVYRPGGTTVNNGAPYDAHFSAQSGRTSISDATDPSCFLSDNGPGGLFLSGIGSAGSTITFTKNTPAVTTITLPYSQNFDGSVYPPDFWLRSKNGAFDFDCVTASLYPTAYPQSGVKKWSGIPAIYARKMIMPLWSAPNFFHLETLIICMCYPSGCIGMTECLTRMTDCKCMSIIT